MHGIKLPYSDPEIDKLAYEAWYTEGTLIRAAQKLKDNGVVSFRKKPFSPVGLRKATLRYMINNYAESRAALKQLYDDNGYKVEDDFLDRLMIKMAIYAFNNPSRMKFWLEEHNLIEKHKDFIESLMAL
jgi:hypothetical protein